MQRKIDVAHPSHTFHYKDHEIMIYSDAPMTPEGRKKWFRLYKDLDKRGVESLGCTQHEGSWYVYYQMSMRAKEIVISYELVEKTLDRTLEVCRNDGD